jgi:hypothetical protein
MLSDWLCRHLKEFSMKVAFGKEEEAAKIIRPPEFFAAEPARVV